MEYQWISLSGRVWAPRCPVHPLWWSSHPGSTEWQPAMWAKTHRWWKQPASWVTAHIFKGISEPHTFALTWVPSLALGSLNLSSLPPIVFFSFFFFFVCVCVCTLRQPPFSFPRPLYLFVCQCGPPATRLACQEIRIVLPASAQPHRPPVTAPRSAPRWLVLSITIYLLLE